MTENLADQIRLAVRIYLDHAYGDQPPESAGKFIPPDGADPADWLMSDIAERSPADAPIEDVRSFALRIGNRLYPHMKLRLSRPPQKTVYLFSVDCHDAFLFAPAGSPDHEALEDLKRRNLEMAAAIGAAWEEVRLPTEHAYLREMIDEARRKKPEGGC